MNPIRLLKILMKANKLATLFQQASASYDRSHDVSKSLFASKLFWVNVLTGAADLMGVLPLPTAYVVPTLAVVNVVLRMLTNKPVHVVPK